MIQDPSTSSGQLAVGTNVVYASPADLAGFSLSPAAADCSLTIYDSAAAASGTIVGQMSLKANAASDQVPLSLLVRCNKGIVAVVAGTGATAVVLFNPSR